MINLKELVSYADGAVASRMVISRKAGNITFFSFDENTDPDRWERDWHRSS
ncbi:MAG: hypothetical protein Q8N94_05060 [Methanoregula sp.]|nr:hypothetical protein [Methanoregula sp.]